MSGREKIDRAREKNPGDATFTEVTLALATPPTPRAALRAQAGLEASSSGRPTPSELFERYVTFVWRVVAALGVREADVGDVTQDVFVVAFARLESFEPERSSATSWLYGIATRVAANHRRKAHVRRETAGDPEPHAGSTTASAAEEQVLRRELADALFALHEHQRDVFVLFEIAELTMHEVAVTVGCPLKTAYKRLYAARRALAARLGGKGGT